MLDWCNHDERSETHCYSEHTSDREKERCTKLHMGYDEQMGCWSGIKRRVMTMVKPTGQKTAKATTTLLNDVKRCQNTRRSNQIKKLSVQSLDSTKL
jgi:hypothetical protein